MKKFFTAVLLAALCTIAGAQSHSFKLGKWVEIRNSILKELEHSYVDTLPVDRMHRAGLDAMLESLDPYTVYVPEEENENLEMMIHKTYGGIGAMIYKPDKNGNVIINEPYAGSPAQKYGLKCGDEIMEIDGQTVSGLTSQESSERMRGEPGSKVVFKVKKLRPAGIEEITVVREKIRIPDVEYYGMLNGTVGYISQTGFTEGVSSEVGKAVRELKSKGMKTLVLDLRGNGGGLLSEAADIVSLFVPKGSVVVTARGRDPRASYVVKTQKDPIDLKLPVVILVDGASASASEIVAGALQDLDRATVMGKRTYGKGLVQTIRPLPYGGELKITTAKYYTPSGRCVQAIDYSDRDGEGRVKHIPDSLMKEFRTSGGRIVKDGGGITPDIEINIKDYSRLVYSLVAYGITEQYALEYVRRHDSIPPVDEFHLSDADYEEFIAYAKDREFDYRSGAKTYFDQMRKELSKDGIEDSMTAELDALQKSLEMDKETFLRLKKKEIVPFLEEEIAVRYYFQEAGVKVRIRYDEALWKALESPLVKF